MNNRNMGKTAPSIWRRRKWHLKGGLAVACLLGTVQAGPASETATTTFQIPSSITVEPLA